MDAKNPFEHGTLVYGGYFINRIDDIERINQNIKSNLNTILISPRRWGKTSLVRHLSKANSKNKKIVFCHFDCFSTRNEKEFYELYAKTIIKATSNKFEEIAKQIKTHLSNLRPKLVLGTDPLTDFSLQFDMEETENNFMEILDLPNKIAKKKKVKIVVCIDEFQNITEFEGPLAFQKQLRAAWQTHSHAKYILYGSKKYMLKTLFEKRQKPFFQFGDVMYLQKITANHFQKYIKKQFEKVGSSITADALALITDSMQCHSYYVQQLSHLIFIQNHKKVDVKQVKQGIETLLIRNQPYFESKFEQSSRTQISLLRALADGNTIGLTAKNTLQRYNLGTSANVVNNLKQLLKREIIDREKGKHFLIDPAYQYWLKKVFNLN